MSHIDSLLDDVDFDIDPASESQLNAKPKRSRPRVRMPKKMRQSYDRNPSLFIRRVVVFGFFIALLTACWIYLLTPASEPVREPLFAAWHFAEEKIAWFKATDKQALFTTVGVFIMTKMGLISWFHKQITGREL